LVRGQWLVQIQIIDPDRVPAVMRIILGASNDSGGTNTAEPAPRASGIKIGRRVLLGIVVVVLVVAGVVVLLPTASPPPSSTTTGSTTISSGADTIIAAALQSNPAGFTLSSSKQPASSSADWAILQQSDGSEANVTVILYISTNASQEYFGRVVAGVENLPGYTNVTSSLTSFQGYGPCYGYGEDVDSIAVINGICTKGNAFLQVHLVSGIDFPDLEDDLTSIMGALYQSAT